MNLNTMKHYLNPNVKLVHFSLCILVVLCFGQCTKQAKNGVETPSKFTKIDTLRSKYLALNDSIVIAWNNMINDDNTKFSNLDRLLDEVKYTNSGDTAKITVFKVRLGDLKEMRYNQKTMADSDLIDQYDFASVNLVNEIITFAMAHPEYERYPLMDQLITEIRESESNVLRFRIYYDLFVKDYNLFLDEHQSVLHEIESNVNHQKRPLFERPHDKQANYAE